ncbi:MAG: hypothetical protein RLZZ175_578 [Bacteroidota bacterium]|jgi:hypothetical protein
MTKDQINALVSSHEEERYSATIAYIKAQKTVYILSDNGGMVTMGTGEEGDEDSDTIIPIWPTAESAKACAAGDWSNCKADSFELVEWNEFILEELIEDKVMISVYASPEDDGYLLSAEDLKEALS